VVMICVENEIKVERGKALPQNRTTTSPQAGVEGFRMKLGYRMLSSSDLRTAARRLLTPNLL
jgi:hypothetical protein